MPDTSGFENTLIFPLVEAIFGRRSRRFACGASIPDGPFAYTSDKESMPLSDVEQMMVLTTVAGNTGWHYLHMFNPKYLPHLPNYAAAAGGRTFPSGAGFHTSDIFFTDDNGVYFLPTRDAPALVESDEAGKVDVDALIDAHRSRIRKLADGRLHIPAEEPYVESHNLWIANIPGSTFIIPVGDLAQHVVANLCYYLQNGYVVFDDVNREQIPGLERFSRLADLENPLPLTFVEQASLAECSVEIGTACYAGALMLQAMGLGGWMYDGLNPFAILGASGDPEVPGLGFRYDTDERWSLPNPTGLPGVFEGFCPPHYPDMRAAVEAVAERKFGPGGPFNPDTPGPFCETSTIRGAAEVHSEEFKDCVGLMAQYVFDRFGKFPGTVPTILVLMYLQAHHLDLDFYDRYFEQGAYLKSHAEHMSRWHNKAMSDE